MSASKSIAVVGSGFLGLTIALRLSQQGHEVTLFEASEEIGGLASVWKIGEFIWDRHYHVTLLSDSFTRKIVSELGLEDEFCWVETKTGFFSGGRLYSMSNSLEFLKFPPLGLIDKFRLGATIFYASRVTDWKALEKVSVEDWLTRLSGKSVFEKIWKPLLRAKLGEAYRESSAAFIWATIQRMYAARRSGLKKEMFGYVRGGYAPILKRFSERLAESGVSINLSSPIKAISNENDRLIVQSALGSAEFDDVILTISPKAAARVLKELRPEEATRLEALEYQGIVCASMLSKTPISEFYVTNITDESPFTGIIEMTALVSKEEFDGNSLVYLPKYCSSDDSLFAKSDEEIREDFLSALEKMYSHFNRSDVLDFKISRVREVFPLPSIGYSERLPDWDRLGEGVHLVNSARITNGTLNINETIQLAENFAAKFESK
ncbi:MAG: NAD(P)/FAD-dependent oxidoreductase [Pyrinomonadaceae bacterium]